MSNITKTDNVVETLANLKFTFRTLQGISKATEIEVSEVKEIINELVSEGTVRRSMLEKEVFGLISRVKTVEEVRASLNETSDEDDEGVIKIRLGEVW